MYPIELLTDKDRLIINEYLKARGYTLSNLDNVLNNWNKNKKTLLKIFGNKLRISFPIETKVRSNYLKQQLEDFYIYPKNLFVNFYNENFTNKDIRSMINKNPSLLVKSWNLKNDFIIDTFYFFVTNSNISLDNYRYFLFLLDYNFVYDNCYSGSFPLVFINPDKDKELVIKSGIKIMRAIRKVLDYFDYKSFDLFEKWRDGVSIIRTTTKTISNLTLSIHPIDFITVSDNNSNWSSCLGWTNKGCYSNGTLELLNSNMAIVCYIENPNKEYFIEDIDYKIPNKMWRAIGYIHKKISIIGKNYPFYDEDISKQALSFIEKIVRENVKWTYYYRQQEYKDMFYFEKDQDMGRGSMEDIKYLIDNHEKACYGKHIFFGGNNVYNDLAADPTYKYFCSRNQVKKNLFLNISGKCSCLICGEDIEDTGDLKICYDCSKKFLCCSCKEINNVNNYYKVTILRSFPYWLDFKDYEIENLPSWILDSKVYCESCLEKLFDFENLALFENNDHKILFSKHSENYTYYYGNKYYPSFYLWYYQRYVLKDNLPDNPSVFFIKKMERFFSKKVHIVRFQDIDRIGQKYISKIS